MIKVQPLVSIIIPNYNHSKYLDECIQSAIHQTYQNVEIIILDNQSEDDSVQVARKYRSQRIRICRNTFNVLNTSYKVLSALLSGKYMMMLCADDCIAEDFVEKAVAIMEQYPSVGYVHGERDFITETGELLELEPFFNCSFVAPGIDVMPLYMVTTIAHPSQGIYRTEIFRCIGGFDMEIDHMNADRMLWFYLSYQSDYAYIQEKMSKIRVGNQTETFITQSNFQHPILCHLTIKEMVSFARKKGITAVYERETEALTRLAREFLNYATGMLLAGDFVCAGRYLDYAKTISEQIEVTDEYRHLEKMQKKDEKLDLVYLKTLATGALQKARYYEPPKHYEKIDVNHLNEWIGEERGLLRQACQS